MSNKSEAEIIADEVINEIQEIIKIITDIFQEDHRDPIIAAAGSISFLVNTVEALKGKTPAIPSIDELLKSLKFLLKGLINGSVKKRLESKSPTKTNKIIH